MSSAYLINQQNEDGKFICNICSLEIESNKIIGLKCNYKKHIFCYDCINDWYKEIRFNVKSVMCSNYNIIRMCPICRKNGGYLPHLGGDYFHDIHCDKNQNRITCGHPLRNKKDYCMSLGNSIYNNKCKRHFMMINKKKEKELIEDK